MVGFTFQPGDIVRLKMWDEIWDDYGEFEKFPNKDTIQLNGITYHESYIDRTWFYSREILEIDSNGVIHFVDINDHDWPDCPLNGFVCTEELLELFPGFKNTSE